jgi:hypothetical protein
MNMPRYGCGLALKSSPKSKSEMIAAPTNTTSMPRRLMAFWYSGRFRRLPGGTDDCTFSIYVLPDLRAPIMTFYVFVT